MLNRRTIYKKHYVEGVVLIVDINSSEKLIECDPNRITAQFFRDLLGGGIKAVEEARGSVINITGDGFTAVLPTETDAAHASWAIARDLRKLREYLSDRHDDGSNVWPQMDVGVGLKIAIERGELEVSSISSSFLGQQPYLVGAAAVYAARIMAFGEGDRCLVGPRAAENWPYAGLSGPYEGKGKHEGFTYQYYFYDLDELWVD